MCFSDKGGTYLRKDSEGFVIRTARTNDLTRRELEHVRDPTLKDLDFDAVHLIDVRAEQRGLEQMLHDQYNTPMNAIRPIRPVNSGSSNVARMDGAQRRNPGS